MGPLLLRITTQSKDDFNLILVMLSRHVFLILYQFLQTSLCNCGTHCMDIKCQKTEVLSKGSFKDCDRMIVDEIETRTQNMLGSVGVKPTNFVNPELRWKTTRKGFRTFRKRVVGTSTNNVLMDARSPHRDLSSDSESKKHGVAVLGRLFTDQVQHVIKKRRRLRHSSSPSIWNESLSLKSMLNKTPPCKGASGQCCSADLDCLPEAMTSDDKIGSVFSPKDVDNSLTDGKPPKSMHWKKYLDFSGIALLADTACRILTNDIEYAKEELITNQSSTAKITDIAASVSSVDAVIKEPVASIDTVDEFVENLPPEVKPSDTQDIHTIGLQKASDINSSEVINESASVKCNKLHWDLNIDMVEWEQPLDNNVELLQKTECTGMCADPVDNKIHSSGFENFDSGCPSQTEILETHSFNGVMQSREEYSLHDVYSGLPAEGKVTSVEGVNHEEDFRKPSDIPDILIAETCQTVNGDNSKLGIMTSSCESLEQEGNFCLVGTTSGEMQPGQAVNVLSQEKDVAPTPDLAPTMTSLISSMENGCMAVNVRMSETQTGYESSFEDGELREDHVLSREEDENEVDVEIVSVDYGIDGEVKHNASNLCPPESSSPKSVVQDGLCDVMMRLAQSSNSNTKQQSILDLQLLEGCEASSDRGVATNDGIGSCAIESVPITSGGKRLLLLEEPSRSDVTRRKKAVNAKQIGCSNLDEGSVPALEEKEAGSDKYFRRVILPDKDHKDDDCVGSSASSWNPRNGHYLTSNQRPEDDYSRPNDEKTRELDYHGQRRPGSNSSKGTSPSRLSRNGSRSRSRGSRPSIIRQGFTRSTRNDFQSAAPDDLASYNHSLVSERMVHSSPQRERHGISPIPIREPNFSRPHKNARSRPRIPHSPESNFPRERYIGFKRHNRFPDLRFDDRMERSLPFNESNFIPNEEDNLFPSSGRFTSKYNSRRNDSWNVDYDRNRSRSPGRIFQRNQRFNRVDSTGRTNFEEQFRNDMVRQGRYTDMTGRGNKYDTYDMNYNDRRHETNDFANRSWNYAQDFEAYNIRDENRYTRSFNDRRELIMNTRGKREPSWSSRGDRAYTSGSNFSAIPDFYDGSPKQR